MGRTLTRCGESRKAAGINSNTGHVDGPVGLHLHEEALAALRGDFVNFDDGVSELPVTFVRPVRPYCAYSMEDWLLRQQVIARYQAVVDDLNGDLLFNGNTVSIMLPGHPEFNFELEDGPSVVEECDKFVARAKQVAFAAALA